MLSLINLRDSYAQNSMQLLFASNPGASNPVALNILTAITDQLSTFKQPAESPHRHPTKPWVNVDNDNFYNSPQCHAAKQHD